jgi:hypothetical protein
VIDSSAIARSYLRRFFVVNLLSVLPLPQVSIWNFLNRPKGAELLLPGGLPRRGRCRPRRGRRVLCFLSLVLLLEEMCSLFFSVPCSSICKFVNYLTNNLTYISPVSGIHRKKIL